MITVHRVSGHSMTPLYQEGDIVIALGAKPGVGDVVIARMAGTTVLKRIASMTSARFYLHGDNSLQSVDSRDYGPVGRHDILGVVKLRFATTTDAPKIVHPKAMVWAYGLVVWIGLLSLAQLFRIDELIPETERWGMMGGLHASTAIMYLLIVGEIFALPVLMRMRLSPLARLVGAGLNIIVPWVWILIGLWLMGTEAPTLLLGTLIDVGSAALIVVSMLWLICALQVLKSLGYQWQNILPARLRS